MLNFNYYVGGVTQMFANKGFQASGGVNPSDNKGYGQYLKPYFYNIGFLRFVCVLLIFLVHYCSKSHFGALGGIYENFMASGECGYMAVHFFFIMAGFFLALTFKKELSVIDFIKKKIIRLWPLVVWVLILFLIADVVGIVKHFDLYNNILSLLFLSNSGVSLRWGNIGHDWFISVLFFVSIFYFYIFKYFKKTSYNFFIPILVLLGYTFLVHVTNGRLWGHIHTTNNIFNWGMLYGISGMGLGYLVYEFYQYLKLQPFVDSIKSIIVYTIAEGYLLGFVVYESGFHKMKFDNKIILIVAFVGLFILFLLKRGLVSKVLDNKFSLIMGQYTFAFYMTHGFLKNIMKYYWINPHKDICLLHPYLSVFCSFVLCFVFAVITYHLVEVPAGKYLKKKLFPPVEN